MMTYGILLTGEPGSGKTTSAISFHPPKIKNPRRLVIGMEADRHLQFQGEENDYQHLRWFDFTDWTTEIANSYQWTPDLFLKLWKAIENNEYDVLVIDNIDEFEFAMTDVLTGSVQDVSLLKEIGLIKKISWAYYYQHGGPKKSVASQQMGAVYKELMKQIVIHCRRNNVSFIATTPVKNRWSKFGTSDMKIIGRTPKMMNDSWQWMMDAILVTSMSVTVDEKNVLSIRKEINIPVEIGEIVRLARPQVEIDPFMPKAFLGLPRRQFTFTTWSSFWEMVQREIDNPKSFDEGVRVLKPQMDEEEIQLERYYNLLNKIYSVVCKSVKWKSKYPNMQFNAFANKIDGWSLEYGFPRTPDSKEAIESLIKDHINNE